MGAAAGPGGRESWSGAIAQVIGITIALALLGAVMAMMFRPGAALGIMIASMLLWPEYLRIPVGLAQMSVPRIMALVLIARLLLRGGKPPTWCWVDWLVAGEWAWELLATVLMNAESQHLTYMIGRVFDTVCMYFAARLVLRSRADYAAMIPWLSTTAVVMGVFGAIESAASWSPYTRLFELGGVGWFDKENEYRYGFLRAKASTGHAIYFGLAMILVTGMLLSMRSLSRWGGPLWIVIALGTLGVLSSMSSGPQMALVILMITGSFIFARVLIRPTLVCLFLLCVMVEAAANRHFYQLIDYLALSGETAWYRTRLLEVAVGHLSEYWLLGFGGRTPHYWALEIDGRLHVDLVNQYVIVATNGGLLALAAYLGTIVGSIRAAARVAKQRADPAASQVGFLFVCVLLAIALATMSVGLFGPPMLLTNVLMGAMISLPAAMGVRSVRSPAPRKPGPSFPPMEAPAS